jgi:hypothetical protein
MGGPSVSHQRHKPVTGIFGKGLPDVPFVLVRTRDFQFLWRLPKRLRWRRIVFVLVAASGWVFEAARRLVGG